MNITVLFLASSSIYSNSPMFVGNNMLFKRSSFSNSLTTLFFNLDRFHLEKCIFNKIQGSIINNKGYDHMLHNIKLANAESPVEVKNLDLNEQYKKEITTALVIHDCTFKDITVTSGFAIDIYGEKPFYMTDCLFSKIESRDSTIHLKVRASTISHICMFNCHSDQFSFIHADISADSFSKILYSTFFLENHQSEFEKESFEFQHGYEEVQCSNFTQLKSNSNLLFIDDTLCFIFSMNTINSNRGNENIIKTSLDDSYYFYCKNTNFITNRYNKNLFLYDKSEKWNQHMDFHDCCFIDNRKDDESNQNSFHFTNAKCYAYFSNCHFDALSSTSQLTLTNGSTIHYNNELIITNDVAHYVTDVCRGTEPINAFACGQNNCPEVGHCVNDNFEFPASGYVTYTLKPKSDIYIILTETDIFTESNVFSYSGAFSMSDVFVKSDEFSRSNFFSKTEGFSKTNYFSKTEQFSETGDFTKSRFFTKSDDFSYSGLFSGSDGFSNSKFFSSTVDFSESDLFSKTTEFSVSREFSKSTDFSNSEFFSRSDKFSKTELFTKSTAFSKSDLFTRTTDFTNSEKFSVSNEFSKSGFFSKSTDFSKSELFTSSADFTKTDLFSRSTDFTKSTFFSRSEEFSTSEFFSKSTDFSESELFSKSVLFSKSSIFSESTDFTKSEAFSISTTFNPTVEFNATSSFTPSNTFSSSEFFSNSKLFTNSDEFSKTSGFSSSTVFTKTDGFSLTNHFSNSMMFSISNMFSKTKGFSSTEEFIKTSGFTKTWEFTKTDDFTKTGEFSNTGKFLKTDEFSKTNGFTKSGDFTKTGEFTQTTEFSKTNGFTETDGFTKTSDFTQTSGFDKTKEFTQTKEFDKTNEFTKSGMFSKSSGFAQTSEFTKTNAFTQSKEFSNSDSFNKSAIFTKSNYFTMSDSFSQSQIFSETRSLPLKSPVIIDVKLDQEKTQLTTGMIAGIGILCGAVFAAVMIAVGIFLLRKRKLGQNVENDEEDIDIVVNTDSSLVTQNPLASFMEIDDPFEDEFE